MERTSFHGGKVEKVPKPRLGNEQLCLDKQTTWSYFSPGHGNLQALAQSPLKSPSGPLVDHSPLTVTEDHILKTPGAEADPLVKQQKHAQALPQSIS